MSVVFVTDTHPLVHYLTGTAKKLPTKVKNVFDDAVAGRKSIFIPAIVLWEFSIIVKAGRVKLEVTLDEYVKEKFFAKAISILDLEVDDILLSSKLNFSRDPFDTIIVATAIRVDCPLITGDSVIHETKPCQILW